MSVDISRRPNNLGHQTTPGTNNVIDATAPVPWGKAEIIYFLCVMIMHQVFVVAVTSSTDNPAAIILTDITLICLCTLILRYYFLSKHKNGWKILIFSESKIKYYKTLAILSGIISGSFFIFTEIFYNFKYTSTLKSLELIIYFLGISLYPFIEELWFRGFIYRGLRNNHGVIVSLTISVIIFLFFHFTDYYLPILLTGVLITIYYEITKSLTGAIILHSTCNLTLYLYHISCIYNIQILS